MLAMTRQKTASMNKQTIQRGVLGVWVIGAFGAYGFQFRDFVGPILDLLGLG